MDRKAEAILNHKISHIESLLADSNIRTLLEGSAHLLEMWIEAANNGQFEDVSLEDIQKTEERARDIRKACRGVLPPNDIRSN